MECAQHLRQLDDWKIGLPSGEWGEVWPAAGSIFEARSQNGGAFLCQFSVRKVFSVLSLQDNLRVQLVQRLSIGSSRGSST
jgi:hypothetical protein